MATGKRSGCAVRMLAATLAMAFQVSGFNDAQAQGKPASCIAALKKDYGSTNTLRSECVNETDCTFQAPPANASALALIGTMTKRAEDCFAAAGLKMSKEETVPGGMTRYYETAGVSQKCAVLIATGATGIAQGMRAICQPTE